MTSRIHAPIGRQLFRSLSHHATALRPHELRTSTAVSQAIGAAALAAVAIGALAIGALAIGRLAIGRARIRRLEIDELVVRKVRVTEALQLPAKPEARRLIGAAETLVESQRSAGHARRLSFERDPSVPPAAAHLATSGRAARRAARGHRAAGSAVVDGLALDRQAAARLPDRRTRQRQCRSASSPTSRASRRRCNDHPAERRILPAACTTTCTGGHGHARGPPDPAALRREPAGDRVSRALSAASQGWPEERAFALMNEVWEPDHVWPTTGATSFTRPMLVRWSGSGSLGGVLRARRLSVSDALNTAMMSCARGCQPCDCARCASLRLRSR